MSKCYLAVVERTRYRYKILMPSPLDIFIPNPDVRERFSTSIRAPSDVVFRVASEFDMQSPLIVRMIIWLREKLLGGKRRERPTSKLIAEMRGYGWACLAERSGELFVAGAVCQPWRADVVFTPVLPEFYLDYCEPGQVKIAWTLEVENIGPEETKFSTETRAVATDDISKRKFLRYWRWARLGIVTIRLVMLPAIRRDAELQWSRQLPAR